MPASSASRCQCQSRTARCSGSGEHAAHVELKVRLLMQVLPQQRAQQTCGAHQERIQAYEQPEEQELFQLVRHRQECVVPAQQTPVSSQHIVVAASSLLIAGTLAKQSKVCGTAAHTRCRSFWPRTSSAALGCHAPALGSSSAVRYSANDPGAART